MVTKSLHLIWVKEVLERIARVVVGLEVGAWKAQGKAAVDQKILSSGKIADHNLQEEEIELS